MTPLSPALAASRPFVTRAALGFGAVVGGFTLSAGYQLVYDEGRDLIMRMRTAMTRRRARNEHIIIALVGTDFPQDVVEQLLRARDRFVTALQIMSTDRLGTEHREQLRGVLAACIRF